MWLLYNSRNSVPEVKGIRNDEGNFASRLTNISQKSFRKTNGNEQYCSSDGMS